MSDEIGEGPWSKIVMTCIGIVTELLKISNEQIYLFNSEQCIESLTVSLLI